MGELEQFMKDVQRKYSDAFKESLSDIIQRISDARAVERFLNEAYSKGIVPLALKDEVISTSGVSEYHKASRLMHKIDSDLQACKTTTDYGRVQSSVLIICKILLNLDYPILTQTAKEFMTNIKEVPEVIAVSICKAKLEAFIRTTVSAPFELFHAEGIIHLDRAAATTIATTIQISNVSLLYNLIVKTIAENSQKFEQLSATLKMHGLPGSALAKKLTDELNEHNAVFHVDPHVNKGLARAVGSIHSANMASAASIPRARIPSDVEKSVNEMFAKYDDLIYDIANLITKAIEQNPQGEIQSLPGVKDYLKTSRHHWSRAGEIESHTSVREAVRFVAKYRTSVLDVKYLERLLERFAIPKGQEKIDDYNSSLEKFKKKAKADLLNDRYISEAICTISETIVFTIRRNLEEVLMDEITDIICKIFEEELSSYVTVKVVSRARSTTFTCYAPESMIQLLILKAQKNLQALIRDIGLMYLKIGYCTLLDYEPDQTTHFNAETEQVQVEESHKDGEKPREYIETIEKLKRENEQLKKEHRMHQDHTTIIQQRYKEIVSLRKKLEETENEKDKVVEECDSVKQKMEIVVEEQLQLKEEYVSLQKRLEEAEKEKGELKAYNSKLKEQNRTATIDVPEASEDSNRIYSPPVKLRLRNFSSYLDSSRSWYSSPFYTHFNGYKMCLRVVPSGLGEGQGKYVSVYAHLMKGDHDDTLPWPFVGSIQLNLLNRIDDIRLSPPQMLNFVEGMDPDANSRVIAGKLIDSGIVSNTGHGLSKAIRRTDLEYSSINDTQYLKDDTIVIQVTNVMVQSTNVAVTQLPWEADKSSKTVKLPMPKFSEWKKSGSRWLSNPFESHSKGYQFKLMVFANGCNDKEGKSVSVYVHLIKGEHDDKLSFPFTGKVCVRLLNSIDKNDTGNHIQKVVEFSDKTEDMRAAGMAPTSEYNEVGVGFDDFLEHDRLDFNLSTNTQYLDHDDSLTFTIPWVKLD